MSKDYCNLEEKISPLANKVRGTLVTIGGDPEFHHDVSVALLQLLEACESSLRKGPITDVLAAYASLEKLYE